MTPHDHSSERASTVSTGRWIAAARAFETARPDRLFNDPWADVLAGDVGRATLDAADYNPFLPVRTRYIDHRIIDAARKNSQIVLLGAGLDTRAFRPPLPAGCTVLEVDFEEEFTKKDELLRTVPAAGPRRSVGSLERIPSGGRL